MNDAQQPTESVELRECNVHIELLNGGTLDLNLRNPRWSDVEVALRWVIDSVPHRLSSEADA